MKQETGTSRNDYHNQGEENIPNELKPQGQTSLFPPGFTGLTTEGRVIVHFADRREFDYDGELIYEGYVDGSRVLWNKEGITMDQKNCMEKEEGVEVSKDPRAFSKLMEDILSSEKQEDLNGKFMALAKQADLSLSMAHALGRSSMRSDIISLLAKVQE